VNIFILLLFNFVSFYVRFV